MRGCVTGIVVVPRALSLESAAYIVAVGGRGDRFIDKRVTVLISNLHGLDVGETSQQIEYVGGLMELDRNDERSTTSWPVF